MGGQSTHLRRSHKWSASRIAFDLQAWGITTSRRTVSLHLLVLGPNRQDGQAAASTIRGRHACATAQSNISALFDGPGAANWPPS